jgi:hypothetical protein
MDWSLRCLVVLCNVFLSCSDIVCDRAIDYPTGLCISFCYPFSSYSVAEVSFLYIYPTVTDQETQRGISIINV